MDCCRGTAIGKDEGDGEGDGDGDGEGDGEGDGDGEGKGDGDGDRVSSSGQFPLTVPIKTNAIIKLYISGLAIIITTAVSKRSWLISFYNNSAL